MKQDNVIELKNPEPFIDDPITDILRQGARKLLTQVLEAEIAFFINQYAEFKDDSGRQRIVRNTEDEIRDFFGLTKGQLTALRYKGLPFVKLSRVSRLYFEKSVVEWLKSMEIRLNQMG